MSRTHRRAAGRQVAVVACVVGVLLAACDPHSAPLVRHQASFRPSAQAGLTIWTGQPCPQVQTLTVELAWSDDRPRTTWVLRSQQPQGATLSEVELGTTPQGFRATTPLPATVDWHNATTVWVKVSTAAGQTSSYATVDAMLADADGREADEYYVEDEGWMTKDGFADLADGQEIAPLCGPGTPAAP